MFKIRKLNKLRKDYLWMRDENEFVLCDFI